MQRHFLCNKASIKLNTSPALVATPSGPSGTCKALRAHAFASIAHVRKSPLDGTEHGATRSTSGLRALDTKTATTSKTTSLAEGSSKQQPKNSNGRRAVLKASKMGAEKVVEMQKALADYMALPASQYSVLDGRKIERVDDNTFRCYVGQLRLFQWTVEPVLMLSVQAEPELGGCTIKMLSCRLEGPPSLVDDINDKIQTQMTNVVRWRYADGAAAKTGPSEVGESKEIVSTTELMVDIEIPTWCYFIPTARIESVGSGVLQGVLNTMVPRFLSHLKADYKAWASGDASRKPVESKMGGF